MYTTSFDLTVAYLESLRNRSGYDRTYRAAEQWILKQATTPTRSQIRSRHIEKGRGDYMPGCVQANKELSIQRSAFRWGMYHDVWNGGDPTIGIKKWKTKKRKRIAKFLELRSLLHCFTMARTDTEIRNRALFGIALLTGCRPSEVRTALMGSIIPYGQFGCWNKGKTKNGEDHEIPISTQAMQWLSSWLEVRGERKTYAHSPYIFYGINPNEPLSDDGVRKEWSKMRTHLGIAGLWNYDLRRTLATYLSNELNYSDKKIQAVLNHYDGRTLSHYCHVSFDALVPVIQHYADWVVSLATGGIPESLTTNP